MKSAFALIEIRLTTNSTSNFKVGLDYETVAASCKTSRILSLRRFWSRASKCFGAIFIDPNLTITPAIDIILERAFITIGGKVSGTLQSIFAGDVESVRIDSNPLSGIARKGAMIFTETRGGFIGANDGALTIVPHKDLIVAVRGTSSEKRRFVSANHRRIRCIKNVLTSGASASFQRTVSSSVVHIACPPQRSHIEADSPSGFALAVHPVIGQGRVAVEAVTTIRTDHDVADVAPAERCVQSLRIRQRIRFASKVTFADTKTFRRFLALEAIRSEVELDDFIGSAC